MTLSHHTMNEAKHYKEAETEARGDENYRLPHPITFALIGLLIQE